MDKLEAVFFDLDGTLINTIGDIAYSYNKGLESMGLRQFSEQEYKQIVGRGSLNLCQNLTNHDENLAQDLHKIGVNFYMDSYNKNSYPYVGLDDAIEVLKTRGIKLAVLSNKPNELTKKIIYSYFPKNTFEMVYGLRDGFKPKPDADFLLEMCRELDVDPKNCIFVGDSEIDMQTAHNANMLAAGVLWGFRPEEITEDSCDVIIEEPADLASLPEIFNNYED